jgi:hypothetical protein
MLAWILFRSMSDSWLSLSDDALHEHAYLVARQVRPLAIVGQCRAELEAMRAITARLEQVSTPGAIAFVCESGDGIAAYGYAAASWVLDLYQWLLTDNAVTSKQRHRIIGLLLGYSVSAISDFTAAESAAPRPT